MVNTIVLAKFLKDRQLKDRQKRYTIRFSRFIGHQRPLAHKIPVQAGINNEVVFNLRGDVFYQLLCFTRSRLYAEKGADILYLVKKKVLLELLRVFKCLRCNARIDVNFKDCKVCNYTFWFGTETNVCSYFGKKFHGFSLSLSNFPKQTHPTDWYRTYHDVVRDIPDMLRCDECWEPTPLSYRGSCGPNCPAL
jgi:ribosomal protein L40E